MSSRIKNTSDNEKTVCEYQKEVISILESLSTAKSVGEVFADWVKCSALAIANACDIIHGERWRQREEEYAHTASSYGEGCKKFADAFGLLALMFDAEISDYLGTIFMELGAKSRDKGQYFTPFHISEMCSELAISKELLKSDGLINMYEPTCGSGGMILAAAKALKKAGVDYQKRMHIVAQDVEWRTVYMCYVQLSLCGINAVVVQGDTLREPEWRNRPNECIFETPKRCGALL